MKAKIMIVEDHEPIRNELKILLSKYGYEIIAIEHFDTVLEDCLRENADLILLDINLPLYDGYYVCRAIREKSEVPIIVVTSRDSEMDELMSGPYVPPSTRVLTNYQPEKVIPLWMECLQDQP